MFIIIALIKLIAIPTRVMIIPESHAKPDENQNSYNLIPYLILYCGNLTVPIHFFYKI